MTPAPLARQEVTAVAPDRDRLHRAAMLGRFLAFVGVLLVGTLLLVLWRSLR